MEELITTLRESAEDVPVPLDLPTEDDLINVEEQLFLTLPAEYREFLLSVSDLVLGTLEPATAADPHSHTYIPELAAEAWDRGLPRHLIPVCRFKEGFYCIDPDGLVGYWASGKFGEQEWDSIWEWAEDVWLASAGR
ncbi:SMI1/KNR4 family protein [Saccharophagus sp. K07]|jgi:hypothetical protein|uniref:SMI1/KNR4 family protein n=1 Tax=Saccharophagus sp. K07 TaxID=2283636 RepID=UPI001651F3A4|nr:SMI1/KNR4 family protein [Saccharophagus sp. K07]MBC6905695.1 SMI1/KNR4 family protein [Saccharophagus sp. K07]